MAGNTENIFGTPPEPLFNVQPSSMKTEILEDWFENLKEENRRNIQQTTFKNVNILLYIVQQAIVNFT